MSSQHAPRMARIALRLHRPFERAEDDPDAKGEDGCTFILGDENAVQQLEAFVRTAACPRWLRARYEVHNRALKRKRKRSDEEGPDAGSSSAAAADEHGNCSEAQSAVAPAASNGISDVLGESASGSGGDNAFALRKTSDVAHAHGLQ